MHWTDVLPMYAVCTACFLTSLTPLGESRRLAVIAFTISPATLKRVLSSNGCRHATARLVGARYDIVLTERNGESRRRFLIGRIRKSQRPQIPTRYLTALQQRLKRGSASSSI